MSIYFSGILSNKIQSTLISIFHYIQILSPIQAQRFVSRVILDHTKLSNKTHHHTPQGGHRKQPRKVDIVGVSMSHPCYGQSELSPACWRLLEIHSKEYTSTLIHLRLKAGKGLSTLSFIPLTAWHFCLQCAPRRVCLGSQATLEAGT